MTVYTATLTGDTLVESISFDANYDSRYHFVAAALAKTLGTYNQDLDFELEGQIVRHTGVQHFSEFNAVLIARWRRFPWDNTIDTSLAVGEGLSYVTETSEIEAQSHAETARLLNYLLFELTLGLPDTPEWSLVARIHHRSGMYGLFSGIHGASNAWGLGLRYAF